MNVNMPHHPEAEKTVLGICLFNGLESVEAVLASSNTEKLFYDARNAEIWARIERLHRSNRPLDVSLVSKDRVESEIDPNYLNEILDSSPPQANLPQYLTIAVDYQRRRSVIRAAIELVNDSQDSTKSIDSSVEAAESAMFSTSPAHQEKTVKQGLNKVIDGWQKAMENPGVITGIPSGIFDLDKITWGFQPEHLVIIGARPSQGKSALLGTIALNCAVMQKIPTLFFSLEGSMEEVLRRMICSYARLDSTDLRAGRFSVGEMKKITMATALVNKSPIHIIDRGGITSGQIRSIARRYVKKYGIKVIMVDYLQKVKPSKKAEKRTYEIGSVSEDLKEMGKELGIPVIAACQLNREVEKDKGRAPRPSDLGDSGMIERDADLIALLYREPEQAPTSEVLNYKLLIGKQRDGLIGVVPVLYFPRITKFEAVSRVV